MTDAERDLVVARLRSAGCVYAEDETALLLAEASSLAAMEEMVDQRVSGRPLEQIVGWALFRGAHVHVSPGVFVPRRRTELLVLLALGHLGAGKVVVDLCCGTGAVGAALAREVPGLEVYAADADPAAVACARRNLPPARVFDGDLYAALPYALLGRVDVLAVNAPYVPTDEIALMPVEAREHEHRVALDGGSDGLDVQRRVVAGAPDWLAHGGLLLVETSVGQAPVTLDLFVAAGLDARIEHYEEYDATVVVGARSGRGAPRIEQVF